MAQGGATNRGQAVLQQQQGMKAGDSMPVRGQAQQRDYLSQQGHGTTCQQGDVSAAAHPWSIAINSSLYFVVHFVASGSRVSHTHLMGWGGAVRSCRQVTPQHAAAWPTSSCSIYNTGAARAPTQCAASKAPAAQVWAPRSPERQMLRQPQITSRLHLLDQAGVQDFDCLPFRLPLYQLVWSCELICICPGWSTLPLTMLPPPVGSSSRSQLPPSPPNPPTHSLV
jgi:hypothetical protein